MAADDEGWGLTEQAPPLRKEEVCSRHFRLTHDITLIIRPTDILSPPGDRYRDQRVQIVGGANGICGSYLRERRLKDAAGGVYFNLHKKINQTVEQAVGRGLAVIGDRLDRDRATRHPNWLPTALHMLRPAQALTRTIFWDIENQLWGLRGSSAAVKSWIAAAVPGQGILRAEAWLSWVSSCQPGSCTGWTRGALVALVAAVTICSALWVEWKG
ncbi:uncharacterized protein LOC117504453 [Thalassophryne amazonica]|uniref:uncharacterized protein LOC117504453 n=1 Tax=Thalassophryne amazonica TaxID=390379 RepID=UPI0014715EED|nr:uncharacterized protein LOC117504453 [Thalassophryne amazonica]